MTDSTFIAQIYDIFDESHFDSDNLKWVAKECKSYYDEYKSPITLDVFKVKIQDVNNDILKITILETLKEVVRYLEAPDLDFIKDQALNFFKNQTLKNAIIESVEILEHKGDFDEIKKLVDNALRAGAERNLGHEYINDIDIRYSEMARDTVETPWDVINDLMQGGLAAGELGVIVAPAGIGKCVGGDTEIEIQYEDIGFSITDELTLWFKPWDIIYVNDDLQMSVYDVSILLSRVGMGK
jgi:hypothetical protein